MDIQRMSKYLFFYKEVEEARDDDNILIKEDPEFQQFVNKAKPVVIESDKVDDVKPEQFDQIKKELQQKLKQMEEDKISLEQRIKDMEATQSEMFEQLIETQKSQKRAQIASLQSALELIPLEGKSAVFGTTRGEPVNIYHQNLVWSDEVTAIKNWARDGKLHCLMVKYSNGEEFYNYRGPPAINQDAIQTLQIQGTHVIQFIFHLAPQTRQLMGLTTCLANGKSMTFGLISSGLESVCYDIKEGFAFVGFISTAFDADAITGIKVVTADRSKHQAFAKLIAQLSQELGTWE